MPVEVILPRVDMDMTTAKISRWLAEDGASVRQGDPLFEIETDKAAMEIEASASGVLRLTSGVRPGEEMAIGAVVAQIFREDEDHTPVQAAPAPPPEPVPALPTEAAPPAAHVPTVSTVEPPTTPTPAAAGLRATPLARRIAHEAGLDLRGLRGSGPRGRITSDDVRRASAAATPEPAVPAQPVGTALHVTRAGSTGVTPVVFLHGFGSESAAWRSLWSLLGTGRPLLALDLPGHGKSPLAGPATLDSLANAVMATLRHEGVEAMHLVGHSLGGTIAAHLACRDLADVRSLLLLAPAGLGPEIDGDFFDGFLRARQPASLLPWMERLFADPARVTQGLLRSTLDAHADPERRAYRTSLRESLFPDGTQSPELRAALADVRVPARIVWGRADAIIPYRHALGAPGEFGLHLLAGVGHMPHIESTQAVARIQLDLIRSTGAD